MAERHLRTLVVAEAYPWPAVDGYKQRLSQIIGGLALAVSVALLVGLLATAQDAQSGAQQPAFAAGLCGCLVAAAVRHN